MTTLVVRPERAVDHGAVRQVVAAAFGSTAEADLVERIRASAEYVPEMALVAELDDRVVGHVMVSGAALRNDAGERAIAMLSPLAVDPDHHGAGIGGALVRAVTAIAGERGEPLVVLEGSPRFYARFGFVHSVPHGIELPLPDWRRRRPPRCCCCGRTIRATSRSAGASRIRRRSTASTTTPDRAHRPDSRP